MKKILLFGIICVALSSCATIFCGSKKQIVVDSNIEKAKVVTVDGFKYRNVTFPFAVKVKRGFQTTIVKGEADGYEPCLIQVDKTFNAVSIINLTNIIAWGIDAATGAMMRPEYNNYELEFVTVKEAPEEISQNTSQKYFVLTEQGLKPAQDSSIPFITIEKKGATQKELFDKIKAFATQFYASPKDVISESANDVITLNGVSTNDILYNKALGVLKVQLNYSLTFKFKDGKIRIDIPSINKMLSTSQSIGGDVSWYEILLNKNRSGSTGYEKIVIYNGKKTHQETVDGIEAYFNKLIDSALNYNASKDDEW